MWLKTSCWVKVALKTLTCCHTKNTQKGQALIGVRGKDKLSENTLDQSMAEAIHPRPNIMAEVRTTRGEGEERIVDILVFPESLGDQQQHSAGTEESSKSLGTGRSQRPDAVSPTKCQIWAVVVLLGLLSVVMLARLIGLAVQHKKTASMERDMEQLLLTLKNLTEQRDSLLCKQDCLDG